MTLKSIVLLIVTIIILSSCKDNEVDNPNPVLVSTSYFSFENNSKVKFVGDSIIYRDFDNSIDTVHFSLKDTLIAIDTLPNQITYQFERYISYDDINYLYLKNYSISSNLDGIIKTEDLINHYLLPYRFTEFSKWNGNQYQTGEIQDYFFESITNTIYMGGNRSILKVLQKDEKNLIQEYKQIEHYASGIGYIYSYSKNINKDIITGQIKSGTIVTLTHIP